MSFHDIRIDTLTMRQVRENLDHIPEQWGLGNSGWYEYTM